MKPRRLLCTAVPLLSLLLCVAMTPTPAAAQVGSCTPVDADPFAHAFRSIAMAEGSSFYLTNFGRANAQAVHVFNITAPQNALQPLPNASAVLTRPVCFTVSPPDAPAVAVNAAPAYGKTLAVAQDYGAVGGPNKDTTIYAPGSGSYQYSFVDVVDVRVLASTGSPGTTLRTVHDFHTALLGLVMAFAEDATVLVSTYNLTHVAAYSPVLTRPPTSTFGAGANDAFLPLPPHFAVDSMQMRGGVLAVTGIQHDTKLTLFCFPAVALYLFDAANGSWEGPNVVRLIRPSPAKTAPNYLPTVSVPSTVPGAVNDMWSNVPCATMPSNAVSVDISAYAVSPDAGPNMVFGVPAQSCVYLTSYVNFTAAHPLVYVRCLPAPVPVDQAKHLGLSVGWFDPFGGVFTVASTDAVAFYAVNDFIANGLDDFAFAVPNRLMLTTGGTRPIRMTATNSAGVIALLVSNLQQPDTELFPATVLPPGELFSYNRYILKKCPTGRFKPKADFNPCLYCPAGTYYNGTGATACLPCEGEGGGGEGPEHAHRSGLSLGEEDEATPYCPTGSIYPYTPAQLAPEEEQTIPEFDSDEFREVFEDLLISTLFSLTRYKVVALWLAFTSLCIVLAVCTTLGHVRGCHGCSKRSRWALSLLARLRHIVEGKFHSKKEAAKRAAAEDAEKNGHQPPLSHGHSGHSGHGGEEEDEEGGITKSAEFEGYTTVVFTMFSLAAIVYTGSYVSRYDPDNSDLGPKDQNIFRSQSTVYRGQEVTEYQASLDGVLHHGFGVEMHLIGMAGTSTCDAAHMALNFTFAGCNLPGRNGGCTDPSYVTYAPLPSDAYTCVVTLSVPDGTSLLDTSSLTLKIPSYVSFQALRLRYTQQSGPLDLNAWASAHEKAHIENTASIAAVAFSELLKFPNASAATPHDPDAQSYLQSFIGREWVLTPVAFRSQLPGQWDDVFRSVWYTQVTSTLPRTLPVQPLTDFLFYDSADGITISISFEINLYFTQFLSQRLVGENEVILTILLSIIAIFHVTEMAEKIVVITLSFCVPLCATYCCESCCGCCNGAGGGSGGARHGGGHAKQYGRLHDDGSLSSHVSASPSLAPHHQQQLHGGGGYQPPAVTGVGASAGQPASAAVIGPGSPDTRSAHEMLAFTPTDSHHDIVTRMAMSAQLNPQFAYGSNAVRAATASASADAAAPKS